jgi:hypothetical protein
MPNIIDLTTSNSQTVHLKSEISTVSLMDNYNVSKYSYLILSRIYSFYANNNIYNISLIVCKQRKLKNIYSNAYEFILHNKKGISISQLKNTPSKISKFRIDPESQKPEQIFYNFLLNAITENNLVPKYTNRQNMFFKNPYLLKAQLSTNRTGYGNVYYQDELVYQGTLYGEYTPFYIVGLIY